MTAVHAIFSAELVESVSTDGVSVTVCRDPNATVVTVEVPETGRRCTVNLNDGVLTVEVPPVPGQDLLAAYVFMGNDYVPTDRPLVTVTIPRTVTAIQSRL